MKNGYGQLTFQRQHYTTHVVGFLLQHGPIPPGKLVTHKCDIKLCVRGECLELGDHSQNNFDAYERGLKKGTTKTRGEANGNARLSLRDVLEIRALKGLRSQRSVAEEWGIGKTTVAKIWNGELWSHAR
jgi:hypothetical protein